MSKRARRSPGAAPFAAFAAAVASYLLGVAIVSSPARYLPGHLALLAVAYALLACSLAALCLFARAVSRVLALPAALALATVLVWHLREQLQVPVFPLTFAAAAAGLGLGVFLLLLVLPGVRGPRALAAAGGAGLLLVLFLVGTYYASPTFRWHLLRHNKLLGTPLYYALAEPVSELTEALWSQRVEPGVLSSRRPLLPLDGVRGPRPHIVFVLVDTLRADSLAAYGGDPADMPWLNSFAESSWVFRDVIANASWTRPSMASLFTGMRQEQHGAVDRHDKLSDEARTLAEVLAQRGYETAAFVANFAAVGSDAGFAQGFDVFRELRGGMWPYARAGKVNGEVARWLAGFERRHPAADTPLFLYVHYLDPHLPYLSGGVGAKRHDVAHDAYRNELRYLDRSLPDLVDSVSRTLGDRTVFLLISDHGEEFGEHGEFGHGKSLYREVIWVPAILRTPRGGSGELSEPLEARDFFDLLVRLSSDAQLDVAAWAAQRGRSRRETSIFSTTDSHLHRPYVNYVSMRAIQDGRQMLIWSGYGSTLELYDLSEDPGQTMNLVPRAPAVAASLFEELGDGSEPWAERVPIHHSDDTLEQLCALGYVECP